MKTLILFFSCLIILFNCSVQNLESKYVDNDLIIETIIDFNHFKAKKTDSTKNKILSTLIKTEVNFHTMDKNDFEKYFLPIDADGNHDADAKKFLFREDYKDFASQYRENKITEISSTLKEKYRNVKLSKTGKDQTRYTTDEYLEFSKILFSHDRQTAYIEVNYYAGIYGDGTGYILRKNNGVWRIVQRINKWIT